MQLKTYLLINSIFSGFSGLLMILIFQYFNSIFDVNNNYFFPILGANLIIFSFFVLYVATKQVKNRALLNIISFLDMIWVLASFIVIIPGLFNFSKLGISIIILIAIWIAFLAYMQFRLTQKIK